MKRVSYIFAIIVSASMTVLSCGSNGSGSTSSSKAPAPQGLHADTSSQSAQNTENLPVTVNEYYTAEGDNAVQFVKEMLESGTAAGIRAEQGNLKHEYFIVLEQPNTMMLIESWKDQKSLDAHKGSAQMAKKNELKAKYGVRIESELYTPKIQAQK